MSRGDGGNDLCKGLLWETLMTNEDPGRCVISTWEDKALVIFLWLLCNEFSSV